MTSLTMGLVSMAGEDEVRARMIGLLRTAGMHAGAQVQVGKTFVDLAAALDDPRMSARIRTLDLVTAVAIGKHGSEQVGDGRRHRSPASPGTRGIATKAAEATGQIKLSRSPRSAPRPRRCWPPARAWILGTVNHYVYLTEEQYVMEPGTQRQDHHVPGESFIGGIVFRLERQRVTDLVRCQKKPTTPAPPRVSPLTPSAPTSAISSAIASGHD